MSRPFAANLNKKLENPDGRVCCVRVVLKGRCPIHGRLHTDPETVTANIRAAAAEISNRKAWIEKVELNTGPEYDLRHVAETDTPQGEMLRYIRELMSNPHSVQELGLDFSQLKSKLAGSGVIVSDEDYSKILSDARDILLTMLEDMEYAESGK